MHKVNPVEGRDYPDCPLFIVYSTFEYYCIVYLYFHTKMVDITGVVALEGVCLDANFEDLVSHFATAGQVDHLLLVQESHSGLYTGRGYIVYSSAEEATNATSTLNGSSIGDMTGKFTLKPAISSCSSEIITLKGKARLDELNISAVSGGGHTFIEQLADKLSSLTDRDVTDLFSKFKSVRGDIFPSGKSYTITTPKLPSFSGNHDKNGYDQWRLQLKILMMDPACSDSQVRSAILQSVRGIAADLLLSMPEGTGLETILNKFDMYFGNVLPLDVLTQQFHTSVQEAKEDVVAWSSRLQKLLNLMKQKRPMPNCEVEQLHRSKFWNGLYSSYIRDATRHRYDNGEEFDEIFSACRALELLPIPKTAATAHQVSAASDGSNVDSSVLDKIFNSLRSLEGRLGKLESARTVPAPTASPAVKSQGTNVDTPLFCTRCKRNTHVFEQCHAKRDKYGKQLKN